MCVKDCGIFEDVKDALQNILNKGSEMKASFQGSSKLRRPSMTLDFMANKICSLTKTQSSNREILK